jgi:beta-lactamase regulating signal transducer with metallopeptidase domain
MSEFANWFSPTVMRPLGWALVHFLWQGLALAALLSVAMTVCRKASTRYVAAVVTLLLMVAAPIITFVVLWHGTPAASASAVSLSHRVGALAPSGAGTAQNPTSSWPSPWQSSRPDALLWFVEAWFLGVLFLSLRTVGGFVLIERMRRKEARPVSAKLNELCVSLQRRLRLDRSVRYCECRRLEAPAVIGWFRPVVMLPVTALTGLSEEQLKAVIAHELAHIRRLDCFVNLFQIAAETLLFYHPAIWWVNKRIRDERENCCDDVAISVCGNAVEYARALTLMEESRSAPTLAMAANRGPLAARVARLLGLGTIGSGIRVAGFAASFVFLAGAVFAGSALLGAAHVSFASNALPAHENTETDLVGGVSANHPATNATPAEARARGGSPDVQPSSASQASPNSHNEPQASSEPQASAKPVAQVAKQNGDQDAEQNKNSGGYIAGLKAEGFDNLSADEVIAMKIQGVTPEYIHEIHAQGLHPSVDELIGMRVQGLTPQYIRDMRAAGINVKTDELIGMKVQGITPEYVKNMQGLGLKFTPDELVGMKVQGVSGEYIRDMRAAGMDGSAECFIGMKVQGITPEYVKKMQSLGLKFTPDELMGMKVQGVSPEYVSEMRAAGFDGNVDHLIGMKVQGVTPEYVKGLQALALEFSGEQLVGMKVQGITPEYIRDMRATGIDGSVDQFIGMKVQGVTPEYVREMRATGLDPTAHQIVAMRVEGVDADYVKALKSAGLQNLTVDDYITAKVRGITPEFVEKARSQGFKDLNLRKLIALKDAGVF